MPVRDLECKKCKHVEKDVFFNTTATLIYKCEKCGHEEYTPIIPTFNFKVKGGTPKFHGGK